MFEAYSARDNSHPRFDQRLPSRAGARPEQWDFFTSLEVPRTAPTNNDGGGYRL
jgi:hypothetical protein